MFIIPTPPRILINKMNELVSNMYFLYQYKYLVLIRNYVNHILYTNTLVVSETKIHYQQLFEF